MEDLETQNEDFGNQVINLENQTKEESLNINSELEKNRATETTKLPNLASMILSSEKDKITENVVNNFTSDMKKSYIEKMLCFLNYFRQYFRITTKEVEQRIISSFKPYNSKFYEEASNNPDLYGPFWIYTTLIFVIASGGSLSKYFNGDNSKNYFQSFVRGAGSLIYIFGFGFPFLIWGYMKFIGEVISYFYILCIYGYSFSPFIPIIILCSCGINVIQWILLCYAIANSTLFVITNLWKEISKQEQKKKYSLIGIIVALQFILFLILKLYFLENNYIKIGNVKTNNNKIE
jgi:hypothetical protein